MKSLPNHTAPLILFSNKNSCSAISFYLDNMVQNIHLDSFFIHSTVLPILNMALYEALVIDLPVCSSPLDYICADASKVNNVVQELLTLALCDELRHTMFVGNMIYRVSIGQAP